MLNALSIDLEDWWCSEFVRTHVPERKEDQTVAATMSLLELLEVNSAKATFFVLGEVADRHPELVKYIHKKGHEIASHGYCHSMLGRLGREGFDLEIKRSVELLSSITGEAPVGFRAPNFSLNTSTGWAFEVLAKHGFKYDSSIFPVKTTLYGVPKAPRHPYRPSFEDITKSDERGCIVEFPPATLAFGATFPVSGGFYFRLLPVWFQKAAIRQINKTWPAVIYLHPWELYAGTPRLRGLSPFARFVTYRGIDRALTKLGVLLRSFTFRPMRDFLNVV